eukprot:20204-Heterococcus_DN1.PRE.2
MAQAHLLYMYFSPSSPTFLSLAVTLSKPLPCCIGATVGQRLLFCTHRGERQEADNEMLAAVQLCFSCLYSGGAEAEAACAVPANANTIIARQQRRASCVESTAAWHGCSVLGAGQVFRASSGRWNGSLGRRAI